MNEMKPEDVIKALKYLVECTDSGLCNKSCPQYRNTYCKPYVLRAALDLLREKDVAYKELWEERMRIYNDLQEWKEECKKYQDAYREKDTEIERLKEQLDHKCVYGHDGEVMEFCVQGPCAHYNMEKQIRTEVTTELKQKFKERFSCNDGVWYGAMSYEEIDQIINEMEENNAKRTE